jgi:hypothetical protein
MTQLSRRDWPRYFDRMSAALAGRAIELDAAGLGLPGEWVRLVSLSYDAEHGELALGLKGGERLVRNPTEIHVHQDDELLHSLELVGAGGRRDFLVLRHPLPLVGARP